LTAFAHSHAYSCEMEKLIGHKVKSIAYISDGTITNIMVAKSDLDNLNKRIKFLIQKNPLYFLRILLKGKNDNSKMSLLCSNTKQLEKNWTNLGDKALWKEFLQNYKIYSKQFVTTTAVPFRAGVILNNLLNAGGQKPDREKELKKMLILVNELRTRAEYIVFEKKVLGGLFKEMAKRRGLKDYKILFNFTPEEIKSFFLKRNILQVYTHYNFIFWVKNGDHIVSRCIKEYKKINNYFFSTKQKRVSILKGHAVFSGKVRGVAKILLVDDNIDKIKNGEVLISINSSPRFIRAIKKCGAIVTDEGGITCHAAIIAREMKKPCIIGTKIATKVFKDGDMVEVDAEKGIVRKI